MSSFNTKYIFSGSPTSPSLGGRSAAARQRLSSKISAPRPMNLPSLKSEIGSGTGKTSTSPATTYTWGMSKDTSKENNTDKKPLNTTSKAAPTSPANSPTASTTTASLKQTEPAIATPVATSPPRAWGTVPKVSTAKVQTSSLDFPTAQEAAAFEKSKKNTLMDNKSYIELMASSPTKLRWDEMADDEDNFSVDTIVFEDGTEFHIDNTDAADAVDDESRLNVNEPPTHSTLKPSPTSAPPSPIDQEPVSPNERFANDYDRSYPPQWKHSPGDTHIQRTNRYSNNSNGSGFNDKRRNSQYNRNSTYRDSSNAYHYNNNNRRSSYNNIRRQSNDNYYNRAPLYQPTAVLKRPSPPEARRPSASSNKSDDGMANAIERARKRKEMQEAEYIAAAERARQKAAALAAALAAKQNEEHPQQESSNDEHSQRNHIEEERLQQESSQPERLEEERSQQESLPPERLEEDRPQQGSLQPECLEKECLQKESIQEPCLEEEHSQGKNLSKEEEAKSDTLEKNAEVLKTDAEKWEQYVQNVRNNTADITNTVTSNDWSTFATRLEKKTLEEKAAVAEQRREKRQRELLEEESRAQHHKGNHGQAQPEVEESAGSQLFEKAENQEPMKESISKKQHTLKNPTDSDLVCVTTKDDAIKRPTQHNFKKNKELANVTQVLSRRSYITALLHEANAPIFPEAFEKLAKKPASLSFMVSPMEEDDIEQFADTSKKVATNPFFPKLIYRPSDADSPFLGIYLTPITPVPNCKKALVPLAKDQYFNIPLFF